MAATTSSPSAPLDLADPAKFRTIRRVPIFDEHDPVVKTVASPSAVTLENPKGLVQVKIGATRDDLVAMARNSNRRAKLGRLPSLQLGHTMGWDAPESWQPKHVGFPHNFTVEEHEGRAHLFADFAYRADQYDEAVTYPRCSIERSHWQDPDHQFVRNVALIRCLPGRDLSVIPYDAKGDGNAAVEPDVPGDDFPVAPPPTDSPSHPDPEPPSNPPAGNPPMNPDEIQAMLAASNSALVTALTGMFTTMTGTIVDAVKPAGAAALDPPVAATPDPTGAGDDFAANYSKAAAPLAADITGMKALLGDIRAEVAGLKAQQATLAGTVDTLVAEQDLATANYKNQEYDRILDDAQVKGFQFDREREREIAMSLPEEKRVDYLKGISLNYKAIPLNVGPIPLGGLPNATGKNDPGYRAARRDYATRHKITKQDVLERDFTLADYANNKA